MDEIIPLQFIKKHFKVTIYKITEMARVGSVFYYQAVTCYGNMVLIIEHYSSDFHQVKTLDFLQMRNKALLNKKWKCFPLIYEQEICVNHPEQIVCMTLVENVQLQDKNDTKSLTYLDILPLGLCGLWMVEQSFNLKEKQFQLHQLFRSEHSKKLFFDFTNIVPKNHSIQDNFQDFLSSLIELLNKFYQKNRIREVIFIKDRIYSFNPEFLRKASDWFQLIVFLNTIPDFTVQTFSPVTSKEKTSKLSKIEGNHAIMYNEKKYEDFLFLDGICVNSFTQIFYQDLVDYFFQQNSQYIIRKEILLTVKINKKKKGNYDSLLVIPQVNKIQCINFFITYLKYISPIIRNIEFSIKDNVLVLNFINQFQVLKKIKFIFYKEYVVKDEEISMIIEKSKLEDCRIYLKSMQITDPFLMFLSNSPKLMSIKEIDISDCSGLTEMGVNTLLISPFCKNVRYLNVSGTYILDTSVQTISLKSSIKTLILNNCRNDTDNGIDLSKMKLEKLQALGVKLDINLNESLKVLKIDQELEMDNLKFLKNLRLTQLKIRIIENKKTLMNVIGVFYKDANPVKAFAEGHMSSTLKKLDLSNSQIKFKTLKPLLWMYELEQVILDECDKIGHQFDAISPKIFSLSLAKLPLTVDNLNIILSKTKMLMNLNIYGTNIKKNELVSLLSMSKKYITNLLISEEQYTNKLIEKNTKFTFQYVENVQVRIKRLLNKQQESVFNYILYKASQSYKALRFLCQSGDKAILIDKIEKFMKMSQLKIIKNIYINSVSLEEQIQLREKNQMNQKYPSLKKKSKSESIEFLIKPYETIDEIMYNFINFIHENPEKPIDIMMAGNKLVDEFVVEMFARFAASRIKSIDFRFCLFHIFDVAQNLFQLPVLQSINGGEYGIELHKMNFVNMSQKYLKFFMKAKSVKSLDIVLDTIEEVEILFSVLFHIVDHHSQTIKQISMSCNKINFNNESRMFFQKMFSLPFLSFLNLKTENCLFENNIEECWEQISNLDNLVNLKLVLPAKAFPHLKLKKLQELHIQFSDNAIQEVTLVKSIKGLQSYQLKEIRLIMANCVNIVHVSKIANALDRFESLQKIELNMEYCPLKESSIFEALQTMSKMPKIKFLEVNVSFAVHTLNELLSSVEQAVQSPKSPFIKIICVTDKSMNFVFNQEELSQQGIQFIL